VQAQESLAITPERKTGVKHAEVITARLVQDDRGWPDWRAEPKGRVIYKIGPEIGVVARNSSRATSEDDASVSWPSIVRRTRH
jgi:hypothetical protein